jgi:hypothetical protein
MRIAPLPILVALALGCGRDAADRGAAPAAPWLVDATARIGLDFVHDAGAPGSFAMPEIMGSGGALLDFDGDGDLDVLLVNARGPNRLWRQEAGLRFVDATRGSGLDAPGWGMGVAVGDFDNDGRADVYLTRNGPNALFRNRGDGTFEDVTARAGVAGGGWSASAAFTDFDGDGFLDLFVTRYLALDPAIECRDAAGRRDYCGPERFPGVHDLLYRNNGDGTFADASRPSGIAAAARHGLGVIAADLTGDGRPDFFVANDRDPNQLWVNRGDGTFADEAMVRGAALDDAGQAKAGMGVACADVDGDGRLDLVVTNLRGEGHTLYRADARGGFEDGSARAGLVAATFRHTGFGVAAPDLDQDGRVDLAVANGHVFRGGAPEPRARLGPHWNEYAEAGQLLRNAGGRFEEPGGAAGALAAEPCVGRGLAAGDVDGDGDLDLLVMAVAGRPRLLLNEAPGRGRWLGVRALDPARRRDAHGAVVTAVTAGGRQVRLAHPAGSYLSSGDPRVHFGLGREDAVTVIEVVWPGGKVERFPGGPADRIVTVRRGEGR